MRFDQSYGYPTQRHHLVEVLEVLTWHRSVLWRYIYIYMIDKSHPQTKLKDAYYSARVSRSRPRSYFSSLPLPSNHLSAANNHQLGQYLKAIKIMVTHLGIQLHRISILVISLLHLHQLSQWQLCLWHVQMHLRVLHKPGRDSKGFFVLVTKCSGYNVALSINSLCSDHYKEFQLGINLFR